MVFLVPGRMSRIKIRPGAAVIEIAHAHAGFLLEGIEIRVVGDEGQPDDADRPDGGQPSGTGHLAPQGDAVFLGQRQVIEIGHDAQDPMSGAGFDDADAGVEQWNCRLGVC